MQMEELQQALDGMSSDGLRFCVDVGGFDSDIFWVGRPMVVSDNAFVVKPVGIDRLITVPFEGEPVFAEDGRAVEFITDAQTRRRARFDTWFSPADVQGLKEDRAVVTPEWLEVQRADYKAEQEASNG